jgi:beta-N-acetylhexosaminidase
MPTYAFICGCLGPALSAAEHSFIRSADPWGLILFRRNIESKEQVRRLVGTFRELVGRADAPVLVDQEGGRVQRMGPPHWPPYPAAAILGRLGGSLDRRAIIALAARLIANDLSEVGINVDCLPVLDVAAAEGHNVIGDRAYSADPAVVAVCGRAAADGLMAGGVLPVMKHIPGHGRANVDSHRELPVIGTARPLLEQVDLHPFRALRDLPIAMTAHVVYEAIDPTAPATTSPVVIEEVVRRQIGFDGLLLSDDLSMQALNGSLRERAEAALRAGTDIVLHCNGDLAEAEQVASAAAPLAGKASERAQAALQRAAARVPFDPVEGRARLEAALAASI